MEFKFDEPKAAQAAAWLLRRHQKRLNGLELAKLLYLADRHALCQLGYPITGDRLVCISAGPVLQRVFELTRRSNQLNQRPGSLWSEYVQLSDDGELQDAGCEDLGDLSEYDCQVLDRICAQFGAMTLYELTRYTFELPEWIDPEGGMVVIDPKVILRSAGFDDEDLASISDQLNAERAFAAALGE